MAVRVTGNQDTSAAVRRTMLAWVMGSVAGVLVMSLPERGDRVVSLSATHGPSVIDLIGVGLLVAAWLPVVALLWARRAALGSRAGMGAAMLATVGVAVLWASIVGDTGREWLLGATLLVIAQLLAVCSIMAGASR